MVSHSKRTSVENIEIFSGKLCETACNSNYIIHPYKGNEAIVANNKTVLTRNNPQRI